MYQYRATLIRVVDGDTIDASVDLGFSVRVDMRLRLAQINAPEMNTQEGKAARAFLADALKDGALTVETFKDKKEKYGRYLAVVYAGSAAVGKSVNAMMIEGGHAVEFMK